jgi:hypothetical protein
MSDKPTPAQRRVLENLIAGRRATFGFAPGRSMAGGLSGTFVALNRKGWTKEGQITEAGRAAVPASR